MCNFLSAIVMRNGDIFCDPEHTDSHDDLIKANNLRTSDVAERGYCKVEFTAGEDMLDPAGYTLRVDEDTTPKWWAKHKDAVEANLRARIERMIVVDEREMLLGGCWIVGKSAIVRNVKTCRIVAVRDSAQIRNVWGSAQITDVWGSAQITGVRDSAQITNVRGSAQIRNVGDSAQISNVRDSAQIRNVWGSAQITDVWGSAQITGVRDSAQIRDVRGSAQITGVWDSAQITNVRGSAQIRNVGDSAQIRNDPRTPKQAQEPQ
jgi:hypothetical protein